ncbi:uncharacterized protein LOC114120057 [Aphis gossypii]|uniref:uncharacterized protein LOC114120057 n=1 Tax=Aphis gossypii TaxID=80765 RepID=UPI0021599E9F|nr:uncharacterized protein LOC114120057 [Aphis gossypii]
MNLKIVTVLILWIFVINGQLFIGSESHIEKKCTLSDFVPICTTIEYKSHTDDYDITAICKTTTEIYDGYLFRMANGIRCYDIKINLRTNAVGMPIMFNGVILTSEKKSLEFTVYNSTYLKFNNYMFTKHDIYDQIKYNTTDWIISDMYMYDNAIPPKKFNYNLFIWKANTIEESFKIKWKQRNSIKMCISISYLLEDESKCTLSMDLSVLNRDDIFDKKIISSYNIKESKVLTTVLFKSDYWLHENETYLLNFNLKRKSSEKKIRNYDSYGYSTYKTVYAENCKIGIKRISQCTDENGNEHEEILTINAKEFQEVYSTSLTADVYPFEYKPQEKSISLISQCLNGGIANKYGCICPPGFKGKNCEHGCGPNKFGTDCAGMCSMHQMQCQQMIFCTKGFGCKCPAGYSGRECNKECTSGTYGANCEQQCSEGCRFNSCNVFTGACDKGCTTNYIPPDCKEKYPWLKSPPQLESSDLKSIKLKIDLNSKNIQGSSNVKSDYYQIVFKMTSEVSEFQYSEMKEIGEQDSVIEITNLKPGMLYTFGAILVSEDGNYNIKNIKTADYYTKCLLPRSTNYDVKLLSGTNYINVTWNKLNDENEEDCKITEYLLKLIYTNTYSFNTAFQPLNYVEEVKSNNNQGYIFENLLPGERYAVQVTAITSSGQSNSSSLSYINTEPYGYIEIKNIKTELNQNSSIIITWDVEQSHAFFSLSYEIKYKVNNHFSCSNKVLTNNWTSVLVYYYKRKEISDLIPNTQYVIKVDPKIQGYTYDDNANIIFVKTPISKPNLTPIINENNSWYITNQSAYFSWKINNTECSKLNGFFRGYQIILKDIIKGTQEEKSIKENTITFDELKPDTKYELQVHVLTNYGYNLEQGLLIPFKTKSKYLVPVDELIVYKKNLKRKSIGIRWSFNDTDIIDGFIVIVIDENLSSTKQIIIEPERCIAWPTFYCTTIDNLIPNNQYTIKIKAKSLDYPTGGSTSSVFTNFNDGFADKPENLRTTNVGPTYVSFEWDIPWIHNGVLKSFIVNIEEISSKDIDKCCESKPDVEIPVTEELPTYNCTINDLKPGSTYSIGVLSKTSSYGQTSKIHVTTLPFSAASDVEDEQTIQIEESTTAQYYDSTTVNEYDDDNR